MRVDEQRSYLPDVLVAREAAAHPARFAPNEVPLVVEVVSKGSMSIDRILKPALYAQAGISFFWRIEVTEEGLTAHTYRLNPAEGVYAETGRWTTMIDLLEPWAIKLPISRLTPKHLPPAG